MIFLKDDCFHVWKHDNSNTPCKISSLDPIDRQNDPAVQDRSHKDLLNDPDRNGSAGRDKVLLSQEAGYVWNRGQYDM